MGDIVLLSICPVGMVGSRDTADAITIVVLVRADLDFDRGVRCRGTVFNGCFGLIFELEIFFLMSSVKHWLQRLQALALDIVL